MSGEGRDIQALELNMLSLALLGAAAVAFTRQRTLVLVVCAALFMGFGGLAAATIYWAVSPALAVVLLSATLGLPLVTLALYGVDLAFAPFCIEMTYPAMVCWLLWPVLVVANFAGMLLLR